MYFKLSNGEFADGDFHALAALLGLLDTELKTINSQIKQSGDPDSDGLCDRGEYFIGVGLAGIQRYIASTYKTLGVEQDTALALPPIAKNQTTAVRALHAGANYWKHQDEWDLTHVAFREVESLKGNAKSTIKTIEQITPWAEYTCSNLLAELLLQDNAINDENLLLSPLLDILKAWRINLDAFHRHSKS
ncbi:hypothetical protein NJC08_08395 [Pseudomonas fluorescens]|uniref:hypothetical protein n=1 Tax=Pseudomonas fluorescens TaxID=294 RepID=UPI00209BAE1F|nr:hypothetical protein [Pseudomonas fluorescens]MCO7626430.1 hypothetical protein [Pseudomonas fluorescens]